MRTTINNNNVRSHNHYKEDFSHGNIECMKDKINREILFVFYTI